MTDYTCARCGKLTDGDARIGDDYYCHTDPGTTCYMEAKWGTSFVDLAGGCYIPRQTFERIGRLDLYTALQYRKDNNDAGVTNTQTGDGEFHIERGAR